MPVRAQVCASISALFHRHSSAEALQNSEAKSWRESEHSRAVSLTCDAGSLEFYKFYEKLNWHEYNKMCF